MTSAVAPKMTGNQAERPKTSPMNSSLVARYEAKRAKVAVWATVRPMAKRLESTARTAAASRPSCGAMRRSAGSDSGSRVDQAAAASATATRTQNVACHEATPRTIEPRAGAMTGTRMKTAIT